MSKPLLLLVDDSAEMGLIVVCLGKRSGWEVLVCVDAETAWIALAQRRPDLVLLDVNLPGASGPDWLRRVRRAPQFAGLPVALYTHWGLAADVAAGLDAGADFVFDKDLAARPADWQSRLVEIQAFVRRPAPYSKLSHGWPAPNASPRIEESEADNQLSASRVAGFNQAIQHSFLRLAPPVVMRVILGQTLTQVFGRSAADAWIATDGSGLDDKRLSPSLDPDAVLYLGSCLLEQMGRLLGAESNSALRDALTEAVPGLSEFLAGS